MTSAETPTQGVVSGLEGVLAVESSVAFIDGPNGTLLYRGYDLRDFVEKASFLSVTYLLWHGRWPTSQELDTFDEVLRTRRLMRPEVAEVIHLTPRETHPTAILRTATSMLSVFDISADSTDPADVWDKATTLVAQMPTLVAAIARHRQGLREIEPEPTLDHASNFLFMLHGTKPAPDDSAALDALLTTYAEHELNASTFAARTTVGTLSDYYSAIVTGIGTVKGPLHGGAIDDSMRLFHEIGKVDAVSPYLDEALAAKRKIPGFGHRVYRTRDPRAFAMEKIGGALGDRRGEPVWSDIAARVERELGERKRLNANVDYYSAIVLYHLGFPLEEFTNVIIASRVSGWTAHIQEQYANNRLIRPRALYRGPMGLSIREGQLTPSR